MPGRKNIFLKIYAAVTKSTEGFRSGLVPVFLHLVLTADQADTPSAASGAGLQHHRIADAQGFHPGFLHMGQGLGAGDHLQGGAADQLLQNSLVAEPLHAFRIRADEYQTVFSAKAGKVGIFRQKAVARMDGLGAAEQGGADDLPFVQIAVRRFRPADAAGLIRQGHMEGVLVCFGIDSHCGNAHFLAGPDDAHGDLSPVGN